jgi:hypothetical protein
MEVESWRVLGKAQVGADTTRNAVVLLDLPEHCLLFPELELQYGMVMVHGSMRMPCYSMISFSSPFHNLKSRTDEEVWLLMQS